MLSYLNFLLRTFFVQQWPQLCIYRGYQFLCNAECSIDMWMWHRFNQNYHAINRPCRKETFSCVYSPHINMLPSSLCYSPNFLPKFIQTECIWWLTRSTQFNKIKITCIHFVAYYFKAFTLGHTDTNTYKLYAMSAFMPRNVNVPIPPMCRYSRSDNSRSSVDVYLP